MTSSSTTIYDVASMAGVSAGTVSKVINYHAGVREATASKVREAMSALHYVAPPPGHRRGFRRPETRPRRTHRLALVVQGMPRPVLQAPVYMDVQRGVEEAARARDKAVLLCHIPHGASVQKPISERVDGVVLFGMPGDATLLAQLAPMPVVLVMGKADDSVRFDHVTYDNQAIGRLAAEYLLSRGHRCCGYVGDPSAGGIFGERKSVFLAAVQAGGGSGFASCIDCRAVGVEDTHTVDRNRMADALDRLLARQPRPTGIFFPADMLTSVAYPLLYERGIVPGRDLDVVSCNNEEILLNNLHPKPAVIDIHAAAVGCRAVEQLLWRIEHPLEPKMKSLIDPELIAYSGT